MDSKGLTLYYVILMLMEMNSLIWILLVVKNRLDK
ncbi:putative membrane protein, partial [Yersinia pestis PY-14]